MLNIRSTNSVSQTQNRLKKLQGSSLFSDLERFGLMGVDALSNATPRSSGTTAESWGYRVFHKNGRYGIQWYNTNVNQGAPIAILIQYGHGTGTGGWVEGYDYINPAIRPVFDRIKSELQRKVKA